MNSRRLRPRRHPRRGATLVLAALLMAFMLAMVAFALDFGYIVLVRTQLQTAADSAAMSAAASAADINRSFAEVLDTAARYADYHVAGGKHVGLNPADVELGFWDFDRRRFMPSGPRCNAVRVVTRRDQTANGEVGLFFGRVLGGGGTALQAEAIAAFEDNFSGFRPPPSGENLEFLPFAIDKRTWDALMAGRGRDDWSWDPDCGEIHRGGDGIPEANVYPRRTGAPGNRGIVDVGSKNNSTRDVRRQILEGLSPEDLSYHGGTLELDEHGKLVLPGTPGLRATLGHELQAIKSQARIVPIFRDVRGRGERARYTIVQFGAVRVLDVRLTGRWKRVIVQRANVTVRGGIRAPDDERTSHSILSPVHLVR